MHGLGGKDTVFKHLENDELLNKYVIDYISTNSVEDTQSCIDFIDKYHNVIIKITFGTQGIDIVHVKKCTHEYNITDDTSEYTVSHNDLIEMINKIFCNKRYIVQQYIHSKTSTGMPFDIRLHVCRGRNARWRIARIYVRIGVNKKVTSNIAYGGGICDTLSFLKAHFKSVDISNSIYNRLIELGNILPDRLQSNYASNIMFSAFGIDVGLDTEGKIYIFEVNTGPGSKFLFIEHARYLAEFAVYLAHKKGASGSL
ncbi:MAG: YheC/YheD family protein [Desulfovibrio sp.]|nr:YheC/YheD family protein [Desulfovibrio sp.]